LIDGPLAAVLTGLSADGHHGATFTTMERRLSLLLLLFALLSLFSVSLAACKLHRSIAVDGAY